MKFLFIGDVHGKFNEYAQIVKDYRDKADFIVQVGDFGLGFHSGADFLIQSLQNTVGNAFFIRGNHDDPAVCHKTAGFIHDGHFMLNGRVMFVGGAWSIDWMYRTPGVNWWEGEECSIKELDRLIDEYESAEPEIMVTHTCPASIAKRLFIDTGNALGTEAHQTRTEEAFEQMWRIHQPKRWIFGHWHHDVSEIIDGCMFTCLDELSVTAIDANEKVNW